MSQLRNMQADKSKQSATQKREHTLLHDARTLMLPHRFWLLRRYLKQQKVPMDLCFRAARLQQAARRTSPDM